jgi:hypothetical protein
MPGLRDSSKRDSSAAQRDSFAGAKEKKKRRAASVGMTGLGTSAGMVAKTN